MFQKLYFMLSIILKWHQTWIVCVALFKVSEKNTEHEDLRKSNRSDVVKKIVWGFKCFKYVIMLSFEIRV